MENNDNKKDTKKDISFISKPMTLNEYADHLGKVVGQFEILAYMAEFRQSKETKPKRKLLTYEERKNRSQWKKKTIQAIKQYKLSKQPSSLPKSKEPIDDISHLM